jgi:TRAP transporter TAXI family solute receptor
MRIWLERAAAVVLAIAGAVALWFAYEGYSRPVDMKVAVGPVAGDDHALLTGLARRLATAKAAIRLTIVPSEGPVHAARSLENGNADLAVIRADLPIPGAARAIASLRKNAVIIIARKTRNSIENFGDLKRRKLGVVGSGGANDRLIDRLAAHYGFSAADVTRVPLTRDEAPEALRDAKVDALLAVGPLHGHGLAAFNTEVARVLRGAPIYVGIDAAAIAKIAPEYESDDIPKGTFRSSPTSPPEDITTLFFANVLVAKSAMSEETAATLTRLIFDARVALQTEYPMARLIEAVSTDKDAAVPIHPGAAAYYDGEEKGFFERYGDALFYGPMLFSIIGTIMLAGFRYLTRDDTFALADRLTRLRQLAKDGAHAHSLDEITVLEEDLGSMFDELVAKLTRGGLSAPEISTGLMVFKHVNDTLSERRRILSDPALAPRPAAAPAVLDEKRIQ